MSVAKKETDAHDPDTRISAQNKTRMLEIMHELSKGNGRPFVEAMADDMGWTLTGATCWSRTYEGKAEVQEKLLAPLFAQFADRYRNTARRILADGEHVVIECRGAVTTKSGRPYNNTYCWVIRMAEGKMKELTEYMDTALLETALDSPN